MTAMILKAILVLVLLFLGYIVVTLINGLLSLSGVSFALDKRGCVMACITALAIAGMMLVLGFYLFRRFSGAP